MASPEHQAALKAGVDKELALYKYPNAGANGLRMISFQDTCAFRGVMGGVMGGALGAAFGILMSSLNPPGMSGGFGGPPGMVNPLNPVAATGPSRPTRPTAPAAISRPPPAVATAIVNSSIATASATSASAAAGTGASALAASSLPAAAASSSARAALVLGPHPLPAAPVIPLSPMDPIYGGQSPLETTSWQQVKQMARDTGRQARGNFKTWGIMSGTYATSECIIESVRGTSDDLNPVMAGCATGAMLAARSGPSGMAVGCAGFAAFSFAMERVMHSM